MGRKTQINFILLRVYTFVIVFTGSILTFYRNRNKSSQNLHAGPLSSKKKKTDKNGF